MFESFHCALLGCLKLCLSSGRSEQERNGGGSVIYVSIGHLTHSTSNLERKQASKATLILLIISEVISIFFVNQGLRAS